MDDAEYARVAAGSPIQRPGREGMARNAAIGLGNAGSRVHLTMLREAAARDPSETVRDAASWAAARIETREKA